jgi:hypothetical protein
MRQLAVAVALLAASQAAWAQGGGRDRNRRVEWSDSVDDGKGRLNNNRRFLLVYIRPADEASDPSEFRNTDVVDASRDSFSFVKIAYDKDAPEIKEWRVPSAPMILGCDKHGNEVIRQAGAGIDHIRAVIKGAADGVAKLEATIKSLKNKIDEADKSGDRARTVKACLELVKLGKKGYPEIPAALAKIESLAAEEWKKVEIAETVDEATAIQSLEGISKEFAGSPPGAEAEIRIADRENKAGSVAAAIARLLKVLKLPLPLFKEKVDEAQKLLDAISAEGAEKVDAAAKIAAGDRDKGREALRKLQKEYAGTEASKKASEALKE